MRFLPIVDRELREGSRRRGTYWLRVRVAFQALLIGLVAYFINLLQPQTKLGTVLFWGLAGISMVFCLLVRPTFHRRLPKPGETGRNAGVALLDGFQRYDVVLGKLAATSITQLLCLARNFPHHGHSAVGGWEWLKGNSGEWCCSW